MDKKKFVFDFAYYVCIAAIIAVVYKYLLPVMAPFIIGFIFAVIVNAILKKTSRRISRVLTLSGIYVVLAVLIVLLGASRIEAIANIDYLGLYNDRIVPLINTVYTSSLTLIRSMPAATQHALLNAMDTISQETQRILFSFSGSAVTWAAGILASIPKLFLNTMIAMIASYYIALDYENVVSIIGRMIPQKFKDLGHEIRIFASEKVIRFLFAYSKLMLLNFTECMIGFTLLKVDNIVIVALFTTIVDVLPVLGTGTVLIPWAVRVFFTNKLRSLALIMMYLIITVIRNSVEPKVVGTSLNLNPLLTFVCMIVGLHFGGVVGLFLLPMIAAFIIHIRKEKPEVLKSFFE